MFREPQWTVWAWVAAALGAQNAPRPTTEAELDQQVIQALVGFARSAETWKAPARARAVYEQILDHYDNENASARAGLGWKRVKDEWQVGTPPDKLPKDAATPAQHKLVADAWRVTQKRVAALHKDFGLALDAAGHRARAVHHLGRALVFAPDDVDCHRALGHEEFDGFHGTAEQIEFVKRMREIRAKARDLAEQTIAVEPVPPERLPIELQKTGIEFAGARSRFITYWVAGSAEEAARCAIWNERAVLLLNYLFADPAQRAQYFDSMPTRWIAVLRTSEQRARLLEVSPVALGGETAARVMLYGSKSFSSRSGPAEWFQHDAHDDDFAVGHATKRGTGWFNPGFGEGLVHTMTALLCNSMHASYFMLPTTRSTATKRPRRPDECLQLLRADIERGEDWPLVQVPRERHENFRDPVRFKSWSFVSWLLARHPDRWVQLLVELGHESRLPEDVAAIFEKVLARKIGEVEAEWREWARAGSSIGRASGLPQ